MNAVNKTITNKLVTVDIYLICKGEKQRKMICKWNDSFSLKNSNQEARREGRMRRGLYCSERKVKVAKRKEKNF